MASSTLATIQQKVRRLTRSPSEAQLSTADLNQYINTFVLYNLPEHLRTFNLRTTFTFVCNPYQDVYATDEISFAGATNNPLYNFQNKYISVHPPLYIAGFGSFYSQSREQFFGIYPNVNNILTIGQSGDGTTTSFSGFITNQTGPNLVNANLTNTQTSTLLQRQVLFSSLASNQMGLSMLDIPVVNTATGFNMPYGNLYEPGTEPLTPPTAMDPTNYVNYVTGQFTVTFLINGVPTAPGAGFQINSQTCPEVVALPQAMCYYDNKFIIRPLPDQPYRINFEVYARPTELLENDQSPQLEEWWEWIAYGAARKVCQDKMDMETVALMEPEYKKQEHLAIRRTIVQYTNDRTATIYTEQTGFPSGWGWGQGWGGPF